MLCVIIVEKLSGRKGKILEKSIYSFCSEIFRRWESNNSIEKYFVEQNSKRLNKDFVLLPKVLLSTSQDLPITSPLGRPQTSYEQSSERSIRRKTQLLRQ